MKQLIPLHQQTINNKSIPTVSARELHRFMEVGKDFSTWIKDRIAEFEYQQERDFIVITGSTNLGSDFSPDLAKSRMGRPSIEYHLTLDMAKELAMVERNPMGRVARKYFIKCEQAALELIPVLQQELLAGNQRWRRIAEYQSMGLTQGEIGKLMDLHRRSVNREIDKMRQCGFVVAAPRQRIDSRSKRMATDDRQLMLFPVGALR